MENIGNETSKYYVNIEAIFTKGKNFNIVAIINAIIATIDQDIAKI